MSDRSKLLLGPLALSLAALIPTLAHADVRIEETSTALNSTVKRWTSIKGDKRAIVSRAETTGVLYNAGGRYGAYVEIARPDQEKIYDIDPQERSYKELTADQFSKILQKGIQAPRNSNEQPLRTLYRSETTAIEVAPTGKEKRIAGLQAEEVIARVVIGAQNLVSGNKFVFTFDQEIWITKDPALLKEIHGFDEAYAEHFGSAATLSQARLLAGEWNDAFITHLRAVNDRVRALGGFPLSSTTTVTEEAVAQVKGEKGSSRKFVVATNEVKRVSMETVPDSEFEVPAGYINSDTKVAVAPRTPAAAPVTQVAKNDPPAAPKMDPPAEVKPPVTVAKADPPAPEVKQPVTAAVAPAKDPAPAPQVAANVPEKVTVPAPEKVAANVPEKAPAPTALPKTPTDLVAAAAKPDPAPAEVVKPLVQNAGPQVAANTGAKPKPESVPVVSAPPTNVIVPGAAVAQASPSAGEKSKGKTKVVKSAPVLVDSNSPQLVIPALGVFNQSGTGGASSVVTVDEPESAWGKNKKKKR